MKAAKHGDLQDGLLAYYLSQVGASDVNVESRLECEPFDYREAMRRDAESSGRHCVGRVREFPWAPKV